MIQLQPVLDFLGQFLGGPEAALIIIIAALKVGLILAHVLGALPLIVLMERKLISWIQDRPGPNRVGPWGILQGIADGVKLLSKESFIPDGADKVMYLVAPAIAITTAFLGICIVPWGPLIDGQHLTSLYGALGLLGMRGSVTTIPMAVTNPNIGVLYVFAMSSIGVYGITLAGWSSNNKWSLLGGVRASAQMISYELALSLSIVGVLLIAGSLNMYDIIRGQEGGFWNWNVFAQPVAFLIFVVAMFAETNRLPFDLAEGESELTAGFHTEYSAMKFAMFFMAEYVNMITVSAVCCTLFLGGYHGLIPLHMISFGHEVPFLVEVVLGPAILIFKIFLFMAFYIFIRAVWPRLRYDHLMDLGWKFLLPMTLVNLVVTAVVVGFVVPASTDHAFGTLPKWFLGGITLAMFVAFEAITSARRRKYLASEYRNLTVSA